MMNLGFLTDELCIKNDGFRQAGSFPLIYDDIVRCLGWGQVFTINKQSAATFNFGTFLRVCSGGVGSEHVHKDNYTADGQCFMQSKILD